MPLQGPWPFGEFLRAVCIRSQDALQGDTLGPWFQASSMEETDDEAAPGLIVEDAESLRAQPS